MTVTAPIAVFRRPSRSPRLLLVLAALAVAACSSPAATTDGNTVTDTVSDAKLPGLDSHDSTGLDTLHDTGSQTDGSLGDNGNSADGVTPDVDLSEVDGVGADGSVDGSGGCEFPTNPSPGEPGSTCKSADQCDSGFCIDGPDGKICTAACVSCCPAGFECGKIGGVDGAFACQPKQLALCQPCQTDAECAKADAGALCISYGDGGSFCGTACTANSDCPSGYDCEDATGQLGAAKQCIRIQGGCSCTKWGALVGATTACSTVNAFGACKGTRKCLISGLSACSALDPAPETCNGVDDNCDGVTDPADATGCTNYYTDNDGDGYGGGKPKCLCTDPGSGTTQGGDCNDQSQLVHPGAKEICDGIDNDCDGLTDPGFPDSNGDGFADCVDPDIDGDGVANAQDCAPANPVIFPGALELCDGLDNDCNGITDDPGAAGCQLWYQDGDSDGAGSGSGKCLCESSGAYTATTSSDCNDANAAIHPGATEICNDVDDNCNGTSDEGCDDDVDLWCDATATVVGTPTICPYGKQDCNDTNASVHPNQSEICGNGIDDNCDGLTDSGTDLSKCVQFYADSDGDGFGDTTKAQCLCAATAQYSAQVGGDCNDGDPAIHPQAKELCNGKDDDCDGTTDGATAVDCKVFYNDVDGDQYGVTADQKCQCAASGTYTATVGGDCNDGASAIHPLAPETCNGIDDDCDGITDPPYSADCTQYFKDADSDGYGNYLTSSKCLCGPGNGYVAQGGDCDDANPLAHPGAVETCNGFDDNCDGSVDPIGSAGCTNYHTDQDGDGYGQTYAQCACQPGGYNTALNGDDCDDTQKAVHPGAIEICDGIDNNCDGQTDEGVQGTYYADADKDGYGGASNQQCAPSTGFSATLGGDCNDNNPSVHPNATEVCNGIDDNCNGQTDENATPSTWYADADGDGYGNSAVSQVACAPPAKYVLDKTDCDDTKAAVNPGATEICDNLDNNCNGQTDEGLTCQACVATTVNALNKSADFSNSSTDWMFDTNSSFVATSGTAHQYLRWGYSAGCGYYGFSNEKATIPFTIPADANFVAIDVAFSNTLDITTTPTTPDPALYMTLTMDGVTKQIGPFSTLHSSTWFTVVWPVSAAQQGKAKTIVATVQSTNDTTSACAGAYYGGIGLDNVRSIAGCADPSKFCASGSTGGGASSQTWYRDADGDGYGDSSASSVACIQPTGFVADKTDCNDGAAAVHPGATEIPCNSIDDDCDGVTDNNLALINPLDAYADITADPGQWWPASTFATTQGTAACWWGNSAGCGYDGPRDNTLAFDAVIPSGIAGLAIDVYFDNRHSVTPETPDTTAKLIVTVNGVTQQVGPFPTVQNPKWRTLQFAVPAADYGKTYAVTVRGVTTAATVTYASGCSAASAGGFAVDNVRGLFSCQSGASACSPGVAASNWFKDADGDGYGDPATSVSACIAPLGYIAAGGDCDDTKAAINPGAKDLCSTVGVDDNCDGVTDGAGSTGCTAYYPDADGDTFGSKSAASTCLCSATAGFVANHTDCDDAKSAVNPSATEVCNGIDDNCDGATDPQNTSGCATYFLDADVDGFGLTASTQCWCAPHLTYTALIGGDCNDNNANINPGKSEVCNSLDDNCNGQTDEGLPTGTWYKDADGDTFGNPALTFAGCDPPGYVTQTNGVDCDDTNASIHPGATEICNLKDDNCDGQTDEGLPTGTWYKDADGDTYGDLNTQLTNSCLLPGYVSNFADCNDTKAAINPAAAEVCYNSIDDNCNGQTDENCPTCTPTVINGFNSSAGWSQPLTSWSIGTSFTPTEGSKCVYFGGTSGYFDSSTSDVLTATFTIPPASPYLTIDYILDNAYNKTGTVDTTLFATFTFSGVTQKVGPFSSLQGTTVHQLKWPIPTNLVGTTQTLVVTPNSYTNATVLSGIMIDNLRTTCN